MTASMFYIFYYNCFLKKIERVLSSSVFWTLYEETKFLAGAGLEEFTPVVSAS